MPVTEKIGGLLGLGSYHCGKEQPRLHDLHAFFVVLESLLEIGHVDLLHEAYAFSGLGSNLSKIREASLHVPEVAGYALGLKGYEPHLPLEIHGVRHRSSEKPLQEIGLASHESRTHAGKPRRYFLVASGSEPFVDVFCDLISDLFGLCSGRGV